MTTQNKLSIASTITSSLTVLAALPYEKDIMQVFPPSWTGPIAIVGVIATVVLRILRNLIPNE